MTRGVEVHRAGVLRRVLLAVGVALLTLPAAAGAQATRTWVDGKVGVGDDANPCSETAPCKTFAGAITKTAAGGEINVIEGGGFGAVTITKSLTISATGVEAGVLVSGTNGITVNTAGDHDTVTLRGLDFNGLGTGLSGVEILHAGTVRLENDEIYGFTDPAIDFQPSAPTASVVPALYVDNAQIHDNNQAGLRAIAPAGKTVNVFVTNSTFENNGCGLVASALAVAPVFTTANCGVASTGASVGTVNMSSTGNSITGNAGAGVMSAGDQATNFLTSDMISGNGLGLSPIDGGKIVSIGSGNTVIGNSTDGSPTSTLGGATGPAGANGQNGTNGKIEVVRCKQVTVKVKKRVHGKIRKVKVKKQKCTGKLVSGPVKFTVSGRRMHATLTRAGHVVASGTMVAGSGHAEGVFVVSRRVKAGAYTLTTSRGQTVLSRRSVRVG